MLAAQFLIFGFSLLRRILTNLTPQLSQISLKPRLSGQRVAEAETIVWNRENEQKEISIIQDYFRDQEKFKFVLQKTLFKTRFWEW